KHPGVLECHHVAGEDCYILKVAAPDLESLQGILRDMRRPAAKTQMSTRTTIVLGTVFEKPGFVPVELDCHGGPPRPGARRVPDRLRVLGNPLYRHQGRVRRTVPSHF